jgi:thiol-disulfide isomerase/thioredoxin
MLRRSKPSLSGATAWLNSNPGDLSDLRGHAVLVDFWTFTCINWLRTVAHVRAWADAYQNDGLFVVGIHTPEFSFEHDLDSVRTAIRERGIDYPVAADNDYTIWKSFDNHYWPALYFVDTNGAVRGHHFGEGSYAQSERTLQRLLGVQRDLSTVVGTGVEAAADWPNLRSPETYLGYARRDNFTPTPISGRAPAKTHRRTPELRLNHWMLQGAWNSLPEKVVLTEPDGRILFRFHARDVHLVLRTADREPVPFRVLIDGEPPTRSHGEDVDTGGYGVVRDGRLYQLVRQIGSVRENTLEVTFSTAGVEAYVFTFG